MELYKRHRPGTLDQVLGCDGAVASLRKMLETSTLPHSILFHGPSGCGKTTLGRIVKDELGCHDLDYREMNSASYRGIDSIRDIQSNMNLAPAGGDVRVWLLDEAHMLSKDAQNAALKMLEDVPRHVYFFLATTDPEKLIAAIRSRCTSMPVRLLTTSEATTLVTRVCKKEKITLSDEISDELILQSGGCARTLLVILDKIYQLDEETRLAAIQEKADEMNEAIDLCRALIQKRGWNVVAKLLRNMKGEPESIRQAVIGYCRNILLKEANHRAYFVLSCFKDNFYDSKSAGLVFAAFEAIHGE